MNSNANTVIDPELASETVKLFAQELKVVRAQLREAERRERKLIVENDTLKADNAVLQERINRLQDELTQSSIKSEKVIPSQFAEPTSDMREEFSRLLAENEDLIREKDNALRTREKLSILREKYKRTKAQAHEYSEARKNLNELYDALSNCTQVLEQSRESAVSEIDFRNFLEDLLYEPVEGQLELSSIEAYKLHKGVLDICKGPYFINSNEVIWSPSGIAVGLVVKPMFRYNPKIRGGTWTKHEDNFDVGKQMDVCLSKKPNGKSRYLGTYERVGEKDTMVIAPETLEHMNHVKLDYVSRQTILFPDLLPPAQTQMIKNMYKGGGHQTPVLCDSMRRI